jgi:hypothetical protein
MRFLVCCEAIAIVATIAILTRLRGHFTIALIIVMEWHQVDISLNEAQGGRLAPRA